MAKLLIRPSIEAHITLALNENEARAFDALVDYGDDAFIKAFYEKLGAAYMQKHEDGLRSLFQSVRTMLPPLLARADAARRAFENPA